MKIAILEDNEERKVEMDRFLRDRFYSYESHFFADANEMIGFLRQHLGDSIAISLDHDLEMIPGHDGRLIDPGTGRDVAEYIASNSASCAVIIHSTNSAAAAGMKLCLEDGGWKTSVVSPYGSLEWIKEVWFPALRRAIIGAARPIAHKQSMSPSEHRAELS